MNKLLINSFPGLRKQYGNHGSNRFSSTGITRLTKGKLMVAGFVETQDLKGGDLMHFKLDEHLELIE